jgi:preprotein translocase subunit SecE
VGSLKPVLQHRSVRFFEDVGANLEDVVWPNAGQWPTG